MLRKLEDALRTALEAPFAHLFPDKLHPVEMATALRQAMDRSRLLSEGTSFVHNRYAVKLNLNDFRRLQAAIPSIERELADHLLRYATGENVVPGSDVLVRLETGEDQAPGQMHIESDFRAPALATLAVVSGLPQRGRQYEVQGQAMLGRGLDCSIRLEEATVSRHHAEINWHFVLYQIRDLDSANGTFVNGTQVLRAPLGDGDLIELGLVQLRFHTR